MVDPKQAQTNQMGSNNVWPGPFDPTTFFRTATDWQNFMSNNHRLHNNNSTLIGNQMERTQLFQDHITFDEQHVNDFKLEYMDLDEFLNENELPADTEQEDQPKRQQQPDYEPLPIPKDCNTSKTLMNQVLRQDSTQQPDTMFQHHPSTPLVNASDGSGFPNISYNNEGGAKQPEPFLNQPMSYAKSLEQSPDIFRFGGDPCNSLNDPLSNSSMDGTIRVRKETVQSSDGNDHGNTVSEDNKDDKYWERRRKNNLAAKRSRDARRAKENQVAIRATFLERENKFLTSELNKAKAENHKLKERLCKYETGFQGGLK